jgi:hypothetical protein
VAFDFDLSPMGWLVHIEVGSKTIVGSLRC